MDIFGNQPWNRGGKWDVPVSELGQSWWNVVRDLRYNISRSQFLDLEFKSKSVWTIYEIQIRIINWFDLSIWWNGLVILTVIYFSFKFGLFGNIAFSGDPYFLPLWCPIFYVYFIAWFTSLTNWLWNFVERRSFGL